MQLTRATPRDAWLVCLAVACGGVFLTVGTGFARFELPKEVVMHAVVATLAAVVVVRGLEADAVDRAAAIFLSALAPSLLFVVSWAHALRQGALTVALVAVFVLARGRPPAALWGALVAAAILAASALGEAVGFWSLSAAGFAPGGLVGQRNHLAHGAVLALAALIGLRSSSRSVECTIFVIASLLAAAIVVTRCRAAYLAMLVASGAGLFLAREVGTRRAIAGIAVGTLLAPMLGTALHWTVPHPYADSLARLGEASQGSGAVRIDEAIATVKLSRHHPITGLGPGQWSVAYVAEAPPDVRRTALADGAVPRLAHGDLLARAVEGGALGLAGTAFLIMTLARTLRRRGDLARVAPLAGAFVVVELLDAGVSIPSTGLVAALLFASLVPRGADAKPARGGRAVSFAIGLCSLGAVLLLSGALAADRDFALSDAPSVLVAACEQDGTAAAHCVDAARRAIIVRDCAGAQRAVAALLRAYPAHPLAPSLTRQAADCSASR